MPLPGIVPSLNKAQNLTLTMLLLSEVYNVIVFNDNDNRNRAIDERADAVCRKMGNSGDEIAFKLYCKAFNHLSEATVWDCVELASSKGRTPVKYLSWLLRRELIKVNKW